MSADIRVYREGYETIFPPDGTDPDPSLHGLIRNYVELYVDTVEPELVAYIPSKSTVLGLRRENLFYHYRPETPAAMAAELRTLLQDLHEDDISDGGVDRTADARRQGLPASVVDSGIFEEGWSLDKSEPSTGLAMDLANAEPAFPGLSRLQREVVLDLIGEQRLLLGLENFEAGLQAIQYLIEHGLDASVAIATSDDATELSTADLVLMPGADRNFEPLDDDSAAALNQRTGKKIENWTAELKVDADAAIENLVLESDRSDYAIYRDIRRIETHIDDGEAVDFDSGYASEVVDIHESVETSEHLTAADRTEVIQAIRQRVEEAQETVAGRIRSEKLPALEDAIDTIADSIDNPFDTYDQLKAAEEIVVHEYSYELPELDSPPPGMETLREEWREVLVETQPDDRVQENIRAEIEGKIDDKKADNEDTLLEKAKRKLDAELRRLGSKHRQNPDRFITQARAIGQAFEGEKASDLPEQTREELAPIINVVTDVTYDEELRQRLRTPLGRKLSGQLLDAYTESVESLVEDVYKRSSDPQTGLAQLREVVANGTLDDQPINDPAVKDAIEYVQEAYDDEYLHQHDKDAFRRDIEESIDILTSDRKDEYETQLTSQFERIDSEYVSVPERKIEIYDAITEIIDNEGRPSKDASAEERKFAQTWREMLDDDSLSSEQKVELAQEIKSLIEERRIRASRPLSSGSEAATDSGSPRSISIGSRTIHIKSLVFFLAVIIFILTLILILILRSRNIVSIPSLGTLVGNSIQSGFILDTPNQGTVSWR